MSEIYWKCSCGETFIDPHSAFLHRDGTGQHQVTPERAESVPVPEPTVEEVREAMRRLWAPAEMEAIREMLYRGEGWVEGAVYED